MEILKEEMFIEVIKIGSVIHIIGILYLLILRYGE